MPLEPGVRVRSRPVGCPDPRQPVAERRGRRQVDMRVASAAWARCRCASVSPGIGDLIWLKGDPLRVRVRPGLEVHLGAGEGDPTVTDPDGLHPPEPAVAGERGDAAGDERRRGASVSVVPARSGASGPCRRAPDRAGPAVHRRARPASCRPHGVRSAPRAAAIGSTVCGQPPWASVRASSGPRR